MDPVLLLRVANDAADGLQHAADVVDFGPGAIDFARMQPAGVPEVGPLAFETESAARAARRASSNSAASSALRLHTWTAIDSATVRFIRFLVPAYGVVDDAGGQDLAAQGECMISYVTGCGDRDDPYKLVPLADRTHRRNALWVVSGWLQRSKKQATRLSEASAQTPPVTADYMVG
ncbi:hypothetical protein BU14_0334s0008, partial [Porphyra umbilicalis]